MSTDVHTFASSEATIRYREPYVSEGLNKKLAVTLPWGTHRGFKLVPEGATDRILTIEADPTYLDHVAVYQSATGYSLTVRKTGGDFDIDLTSYSGITIYVALYVSYSVGATTLATIRTYTEAEFAVAPEKNEVIVLGTVDVPASGIIIASEIHAGGRRMAWQHKTSEQVAWTQILRNTGFEFADITSTDNLAAMYWRQEVAGGGSATLGPDDTDPYSGYKHMLLDYSSGTIDWNLTQFTQGIPLSEGQRFRIKFFKRMVQAATGGSFDVSVAYTTITGGTITSGVLATLDTTIDAAYEEFDQIFEVPSGSGIVSLLAVSISGTNMSFGGGAGDAIRIDDVQMWLEASAENPYQTHDMQGEQGVYALHWFPLGTTFNSIGRRPMIDAESTGIRLVRNDLQNGAGIDPPTLALTGQISELGSSLLNDSAQALTPRIITPVAGSGTSTYTLIWETSVGSDPSRMYAKWDGTIAWTVNAFWVEGTSQWDRDDSGNPASMVEQRLDGMLAHRYLDPGSSAPWSTWDLSWESDPAQSRISHFDGFTRWVGTSADSNPAHTSAPVANALYAKTLTKCWGYLVTDSAGGYTTTDGFNYVASFNGNDARIDFVTAMANATYGVVATIGGTSNNWIVQINNISTAGFDIAIWDTVGGAPVPLGAVLATISFIQIGQQNT